METESRRFIMRTIFTTEDITYLIEQIYNSKDNSERIMLVDESSGQATDVDLAEYLNIKFYSWKERLIEKGKSSINDQPQLSVFEDWVQSLNFSMKESYALVELIDEDVVASQDIDSALKVGRITFLIQADKVKNLDYYVTKIRNNYLGKPEPIQNSFGNIIKAYILMGTLLYEQEPIMTQLGETIIATCNFTISYMSDALTYSDTTIQISLDGDDLYDANGNIVDANGNTTDGEGNPIQTKYLEMPITKITWQNIYSSNPVSTTERPDKTGFVATALSNVKTLAFYDFNKALSMKFNDLFWSGSAYRIDGILQTPKEVNIPVFIRIICKGADGQNHSYVYKDMIDNMEKVLTNNDFTISSLTLKGWGKASVVQQITQGG